MVVAAAELRAHGYREASLEVAERASAWYQTRAAQDGAGANPQQRFRQAVAYYLNEQWDTAQALFQELASQFPRNINYQGYLGVLAAQRCGNRRQTCWETSHYAAIRHDRGVRYGSLARSGARLCESAPLLAWAPVTGGGPTAE